MSSTINHPLRSWRVRNFKSVVDAALELAPLTVLVGANSTGKTSLVQSMLLVAQAADGAAGEPDLPLNGRLVELGEFGDLKRVGAGVSETVAVGCTLAVEQGRGRAAGDSGTVRWDLEITGGGREIGPGRAAVRRVQLVGPADDGESFVFSAERRIRGGARPTAGPADRAMVSLAGRLETPTAANGRSLVRTVGFVHRGGVPVSVFIASDENALRVEAWVGRVRRALRDRRRHPRAEWDRIRGRRHENHPASGERHGRRRTDELATEACDQLMELIVRGVDSDEGAGHPTGAAAADLAATLGALRRDAVRRGFWGPLHLLVNDRRFADTILDQVGAGPPVARPASHAPGADLVSRPLETAGTALADFLAGRILHLGPLRQDPQLLYRTSPARRRGYVGAKGEYAFAVLHQHAGRRVVCPLAEGGQREMPLAQAVNHWLGVLELGCEISTVDRPRLGLEPRVRMVDVHRELNMTAVGVGVSQVLPVLVMGLAADPGTVLLLEQPELHLHPAVQQRLGDFLLACVRTGRQVIVETHSDHLVTRLRRRIAEDAEDRLVDDVGIVFSQRRDGRTDFSRLATNRYGGLEEWPAGFFDDGPRDAQHLIQAGLKKQQDADEHGSPPARSDV